MSDFKKGKRPKKRNRISSLAEERAMSKMKLFLAQIGLLSALGMDEKDSSRKAYHSVFLGGGNPEYFPRKHPVMSYAKQNRLAKQKRKQHGKR